MATLEIISKSGSERYVAVTGLSIEQVDRHTTGVITDKGDALETKLTNKRELAGLQQEVDQENARQAAADKPRQSNGRRHIELVEVADRDDLNRGRGWICTEYDIECKGALPEFEGLAICYVYE